MKPAILLLTAFLLSCGQPVEPTHTPEQTIPAEQPASAPEETETEQEITEPEPVVTPEPVPEPQPDHEPITPPWGSTVIGETAYYIQNGSATALDLCTGEVRTLSVSAREYERINEYDYTDNADTGRLAPWSYNAVFIEAAGALWIIERAYNTVKAQVVTAAGIKDIGFIKQIDLLPLTEATTGNRRLALSYEAGGRFYYVRVYEVRDPNGYIPFQPPPIPDYVLRCQEIILQPQAQRPIATGTETDVYAVEKWSGGFSFEYLGNGRILAAGRLFRLTAQGVEAEL